FTGKLVVELVDVALFEIFEAEVGGEETSGAVLERDATVARSGWGPHPLVARTVGVVNDEKRDAFDFSGSVEADDGFAGAVGSQSEGLPRFGGSLAIGGSHFEDAFVALGIGTAASLGFFDDLAGILGVEGEREKECRAHQRQPLPYGRGSVPS